MMSQRIPCSQQRRRRYTILGLLLLLECVSFAQAVLPRDEEEDKHRRRRPFEKQPNKWGVENDNLNRTSAFEMVSDF